MNSQIDGRDAKEPDSEILMEQGDETVVESVDLFELGDESDRHAGERMYGDEKHHSHHRHHSDGSGHGKKKRRRHSRHKKDNSSNAKTARIVKKVLIIILLVFVILVAVAIATIFVMTKVGRRQLTDYSEVSVEAPEELDVEISDEQVVTYEGKQYVFNENVASVVFLGIDTSELGTEEYGQAGQADAVYIYTFDTVEKVSKVISVSRETMVDVNVTSTSGESAGIEELQLCLAYAYGDGRESSCENTLLSLQRIFYNIPFENYVAVNWDAISVINDAIGGVEVTVLEDVGSMKEGETITLMGENAFDYVHYRDTSYLESNEARLKRQKQYITAFANKLIIKTKLDISTPLTLFGLLDDYMVTNVSVNQVSYFTVQAIANVESFSDVEFISIEGETVAGDDVTGEEHAQFYPDEQQLYEMILEVFYTEVEEDK